MPVSDDISVSSLYSAWIESGTFRCCSLTYFRLEGQINSGLNSAAVIEERLRQDRRMHEARPIPPSHPLGMVRCRGHCTLTESWADGEISEFLSELLLHIFSRQHRLHLLHIGVCCL